MGVVLNWTYWISIVFLSVLLVFPLSSTASFVYGFDPFWQESSTPLQSLQELLAVFTSKLLTLYSAIVLLSYKCKPTHSFVVYLLSMYILSITKH